MVMTKAVLKKELSKLGIKTYRNTKTKASFVRKGDVQNVLTVVARQDQLRGLADAVAKEIKGKVEEDDGLFTITSDDWVIEISDDMLFVSGGDPQKLGRHQQTLKGIAKRGDLEYEIGI